MTFGEMEQPLPLESYSTSIIILTGAAAGIVLGKIVLGATEYDWPYAVACITVGSVIGYMIEPAISQWQDYNPVGLHPPALAKRSLTYIIYISVS